MQAGRRISDVLEVDQNTSEGVVFVAENLVNKPNGFYTYEDILKPFFNEQSEN